MVFIDVTTPADNFLHGLIKISEEHLGEPVTERLINKISADTNYFIRKFFVDNEVEYPEWETICYFDNITLMMHIEFRTMRGEKITIEEAHRRIAEYGHGSQLLT